MIQPFCKAYGSSEKSLSTSSPGVDLAQTQADSRQSSKVYSWTFKSIGVQKSA